jgi:hypothetical protein
MAEPFAATMGWSPLQPCYGVLLATGAHSARFHRAPGMRELGWGPNGHPAFLDHRSIHVSPTFQGFGTGTFMRYEEDG